VYIKHGKSAGTTVERAVLEPWLCPLKEGETGEKNFAGVYVKKGCFDENWADLKKMTEQEIKQIWKDYFVFTVVRNPWSRFVSAVNYLNLTEHNCQEITDKLKSTKNDVVAAHMQAQTPCMMTENGGWAVDYIGSTEDLDSAMKEIHSEISARAGKITSFPSIPEQGTSHSNTKDIETSKCTKFSSPECISAVQEHYANDIKNLEYKQPA